MMIINSLFFF